MTRRGIATTCLVAGVLQLVACGDDAAVPHDAGTGSDATADAGAADAGSSDGGATDAGAGDAGLVPDPPLEMRFCPGAPGCTETGDAPLYVGAARVMITPRFDDTTDRMTVDVDGNHYFEPEQGDQFEDRNHNGVFDPVWLGGHASGRPASGFSDDTWLEALVLRHGDTTIAMVSLDAVGYFKDQIDLVRESLAGDDVDFLTVSATHDHDTIDTMGLWGPSDGFSGVVPEYMQMLRDSVASAVREAQRTAEPANVQYAAFRLRDAPGGVGRYTADSRAPDIIDDEVRLMRFLRAGTDETIATVVNWGSHADYWGYHADQISGDYVSFMRDAIENGVEGPDGTTTPGVGGIVLYFSGAAGGQIGQDGADIRSYDGNMVPYRTRESTSTVGRQVGYLVLRALADGGGSVRDETAALAFRSREFLVKIQNRGFHVALLQGIFDRRTFHWNPDLPIVPDVNEPYILAETSVIDVGRATIIQVPGELDPSLFVGGYDGSYTPEGEPIIQSDAENPPELAMAPGPPYLRDLARSDADYVWISTLADDELGYFIPEFEFALDPANPYVDEYPGHYEETRCLGIDGWPVVKHEIEALLATHP